ncbi:hypothetical protein OH456_06810 [Vibrio sp. La 4.2.2]|uniref:hypothetical protein n=1 Tax=Vibrio sp. La 4.2.2 TaxID=2998830 RepID=UPI0022CDF3A9|nr:hypothetical protein [Vibrio sp. La 4.2.2]MDA0107846.1 hypothetical protein [Vibrio sp. La 4.2.2]
MKMGSFEYVLGKVHRLWTPEELCRALRIHVCDLARLCQEADKSGKGVHFESNEATNHKTKIRCAL